MKENINIENLDIIMEESKRRNTGAFYTPLIWASEADKEISKVFGDDWKEKYVVWDPACGTKNLTKQWSFNELYLSTLEPSDLVVSSNYNQEATAFQMDFLNDDLIVTKDAKNKEVLDVKINDEDNSILAVKAPGLLKAMKEDKPIIIFMNPPYANTSSDKKRKKNNISFTNVKYSMDLNKCSKAGNNLFCQFLYKIDMYKKHFNLTNINICIFSPTTFLIGDECKNLRYLILEDFKFKYGMLFNASHFNDTSDSWGISFSIWKSGETTDKNNFNYEIKDIINDKIEIIDNKTFYNLDTKYKLNSWIKIKSKNKIYSPVFKNGLDYKNNKYGNIEKDSIGFLYSNSNTMTQASSFTDLSSKFFMEPKGSSIIKDNFKKCCLVFTIRKTLSRYKDWINEKDPFLSPESYKWYNNPETDEELDKFDKFNQLMIDSIIYSLVETNSYQSSIPDVTFTHPDNSVKVKRGEKKPMITETIDVKNNFFWMSKDEMVELANENHNNELYNHAITDTDRFVYNEIYKIENGLNDDGNNTFSDEAQAILDHLRNVTRTSFPLRDNAPINLYMNRWDAGWYQIKNMLGNDHKDVKKMNELRKTWEEKNYELLYELGFLLK